MEVIKSFEKQMLSAESGHMPVKAAVLTRLKQELPFVIIAVQSSKPL